MPYELNSPLGLYGRILRDKPGVQSDDPPELAAAVLASSEAICQRLDLIWQALSKIASLDK